MFSQRSSRNPSLIELGGEEKRRELEAACREMWEKEAALDTT